MNKTKLLEIRNDEDKCEALADTIMEALVTDDCDPSRAARDLIDAYLDKDVDGILIALTGWSLESLLARADVDSDEEDDSLND